MKMILIQDGSQNTNVDKPLRIIGDPYKVQVRTLGVTGYLGEVSSRQGWTFEGKGRGFQEHWLEVCAGLSLSF